MLTPRGFVTLQTPHLPQPLSFQNTKPHQGLGFWKGKGIHHDEVTPRLPLLIIIDNDSSDSLHENTKD